MKVLALRADEGACARYRIQEPARVVQAQFDVSIRVDTNIEVDASVDPDGFYSVNEIREDVDLIIFQRPLNNAMFSAIEQAKKQGIATIVDLDDDFEYVHPKNIAYRSMQPSLHPENNYEWAHRAAQAADLVTVSTPALGRYAPKDNFTVLSNRIPASVLEMKKSNAAIKETTVGWPGTVQTHPGDLDVVGDGIAKALQRHGTAFVNVGDGDGIIDALKLRTPMHYTGWVSLDDYYQRLINLISIGIVPLEQSRFNNAKSALKGLEMAALGIPFIASPTPEYRVLADQGIGVLASTPEEWYAALSKWLKNPKKAYLDGQRYRKLVALNHTYENSADAWHCAWRQAVYLRKSCP